MPKDTGIVYIDMASGRTVRSNGSAMVEGPEHRGATRIPDLADAMRTMIVAIAFDAPGDEGLSAWRASSGTRC